MRSKVQKEINESNKVLGNLTDKQLQQYVSDEFKHKRKIGGLVAGNLLENKIRFKKLQKVACVLGGKKQGPITGKKNVENGLISKLGKKMSEYNNRIQNCPHCGKISRGVGYIRWHGDNCKYKK